MRALANAEKVKRLMQELGDRAGGPGRVYFTGGATAVLIGWREATVDVDLKLDPEPLGVFEAIAELKDSLDLNIELAAPDQFIPAISGWQDRSIYLETHGSVAFYHYDPYGQTLAKIERGHTRDLTDAREMLARGLVDRERLREYFEAIRPDLKRYPAIDADAFRRKVEDFLNDG
jgi:hypothetical protein